jgi:hypothetical protein
MSSSSSSQVSHRVLRKAMKRRQKRNKNVQSQVLVSGNDTSSGKVDNIIRRFVQMTNAVKANINISTGATTYNNPTSSATFVASGGTNVTADPMFAMFFTLGDIPQSTTWTAVFDQYRITEISVSFIPNHYQAYGVSASAEIAGPPALQFWYAVDLDDASVVSPLTTLMEYESVRCHTFNGCRPMTVTWKPRIATAAYAGLPFTSYANTADQWIDCSSPAVQYYGLKYGFPCPNNTNSSFPALSVVCTYKIEFKSVR